MRWFKQQIYGKGFDFATDIVDKTLIINKKGLNQSAVKNSSRELVK
jgi:hypothetical protein